MESPTERMPIACVHCAKAKAKCDKKVSTSDVEMFWWRQVVECACCHAACPRDQGDDSLDFDLTLLLAGPLLEMREQADCLPVEGDTSLF